jgi:probable phosphomutase (TIGR03848 family)
LSAVGIVMLLRHGRTASNATAMLAGQQRVALDEAGRAQAEAVGQRLRHARLPLRAVVSSPLPRCRETIALALPQAPVFDEPGLVECGYGQWEGRALKDLAKEPLWKVVQAHPSAARFPGGESMAAMAARAVAAVRDWDTRVTAEHGPGTAIWLACSHGDVIKAIVADALGLHLDLFQRISVDPGSLTVIHYTPLRPFLLRLNDTGGDLSRLRPPARARRRRVSSDATVGGGAGTG